MKVGIIDSGIDITSPEFGNRIDPASVDVAGNRGLADEGGHGTAVAFTLAGRRNNAGTHGIAFDATLLVLRTDDPGTCATSTGTANGCQHDDRNIAAALDVARTNGARVVNISLGGSPASSALAQAINRATAAGIVIVISAGNDGTPEPDPLAAIATNNAVSRNLVIIAGSVSTSDMISSFSNRAGTGAAHFLAAVGENVRAPNNNGQPFLWTGTSFAAPQIAGAAALLAQAFPNLTGAQLVDILFQSARDGGVTGQDAIFGRGILDLTRAFQPLGSTAIAGTAAPVSQTSNGVFSTPIGDARQSGLGTIVLDGFSRAFAINLANTLAAAPPSRSLGGTLLNRQRNVSAGAGGTTIAVTIAGDGRHARIAPTLLSNEDATQARAIAATVTSRLGSKARFAIGFSQGASLLAAGLAGRATPAFLVAADPAASAGFATSPATAAAFRQQLGRWGLTASAETGAVQSLDPLDQYRLSRRADRTGYRQFSLGLDRQFGALSTVVTASYLGESDTLLGARFSPALGAARAQSWFVDAEARVDAGSGWGFGGSLRRGWTIAQVRAGLGGSGLITTSAFAADLDKTGIFGRSDSFGLRFAQPLRVASGGIDLRLPTAYDYATLTASSTATQRLNLAPTGRELDIEARYALRAFGGAVQTNAFWRRNPGNIAAFPDDYGVAFRYGVQF
ncbi:MAG: S8 family peptidase [Sphingomonas sp.]